MQPGRGQCSWIYIASPGFLCPLHSWCCGRGGSWVSKECYRCRRRAIIWQPTKLERPATKLPKLALRTSINFTSKAGCWLDSCHKELVASACTCTTEDLHRSLLSSGGIDPSGLSLPLLPVPTLRHIGSKQCVASLFRLPLGEVPRNVVQELLRGGCDSHLAHIDLALQVLPNHLCQLHNRRAHSSPQCAACWTPRRS